MFLLYFKCVRNRKLLIAVECIFNAANEEGKLCGISWRDSLVRKYKQRLNADI
jgi:hypothetical protein